MHNIAVIGAGMAGCTLARRLVDAGRRVHVFDKGRAAGGRMATRVAGRLRFDHGAQFMSVRGDAMRARLPEWQRAGVLARWPQAAVDGDERWVAVPGMNALAPRMLWGAEFSAQTLIDALGADRFGWWLAEESGMLPDCFDAVLVTVPAPQAAALFARSTGADLHSFVEAMQRIRYAPCWTLMLALSERLDAADCLRFPAGGVLNWAARDSGKPQRDGSRECWVVHADPQWSQQHLECEPEQIEALLTAAFAEALGQAVEPVQRCAHRWRYARVLEPLGQPCLWDADARLGYASDGCLGERIEDAFDSANALADRVLAAEAGLARPMHLAAEQHVHLR
ncbi:NAD(P)/FAD-dependent oxidoreductase [Methyloversatilis universalis]|uniref:NAD(P)/FAD-dependent oxidoreductase n=1 Tax=Methyloversatilis universalis TaxID=378211 RepID=UPI000367FB9B|nr:NAD(P)-binding protein [Methyloversatilis universalis]